MSTGDRDLVAKAFCAECRHGYFKVYLRRNGEAAVFCTKCGEAWEAAPWRVQGEAVGGVRDEPEDVVPEKEGGEG